ncbi:uncharacterized protein MELLADRAFT_93296 [Melampsora larici-populina 98AG31]|uniref:Starter acyltransferase (SAT) domain-containing protein n=1 Tax=Melampsora larici-populina (strain 98AG31 / pathotype 3-4-7) TaxID=747676 RepID=F4S4P4_MELLP|nr:uncharacterized protein MELLADRAFT_93296 [Melampsora larici-populina 98AG31]EGG00392.1 hypothetical protein MELLADRAFT_93296 [Melampsora larici-populina 98AG31]
MTEFNIIASLPSNCGCTFGKTCSIGQLVTEPNTKPPDSYLATCAISFPLIQLVQFAHYITFRRTQGLSVVVAALVAARLPASEDTWPNFYQLDIRALTLLFHIGLQGSIAFPPISLPSKVTSITAEQEGLPTPMLAVTGLPLGPSQKAIEELDEHLQNVYKRIIVS